MFIPGPSTSAIDAHERQYYTDARRSPGLSQRSGAVRLTLLTLALVALTLVFLLWARNLAVR